MGDALDEATIAQLKATFDTFDTDGSGKIDENEMFEMCESLGMAVSRKAVLQMIQAVDTDGNNEIDFDELKLIVSKNTGAAKGAGGISFASVFDRKKNLTPMLFQDEKVGDGIKIAPGKREISHSSSGWGVQLADQWLSTASFDTASVIIGVEELVGDAYIGVCGVNFKRKEWNVELGTSKDQPGLAPWCTVRCSDGVVYYKGRATEQKLCKIGTGDRIAIDVAMRSSSMSVKVLRPDPSTTTGPIIWLEVQEIQIDGLQNEIAIAVALGAEPDGKTSRVKIVGSSCERTQAIQATDVQKSEDEQRGVTVDATTAVALQMAQ